MLVIKEGKVSPIIFQVSFSWKFLSKKLVFPLSSVYSYLSIARRTGQSGIVFALSSAGAGFLLACPLALGWGSLETRSSSQTALLGLG
jgi:hypothetical protein